MTEQAFGESESAEDAAHPGQSFETVAAFGGNVVEDRSGAGDEPAADRRGRLYGGRRLGCHHRTVGRPARGPGAQDAERGRVVARAPALAITVPLVRLTMLTL